MVELIVGGSRRLGGPHPRPLTTAKRGLTGRAGPVHRKPHRSGGEAALGQTAGLSPDRRPRSDSTCSGDADQRLLRPVAQISTCTRGCHAVRDEACAAPSPAVAVPALRRALPRVHLPRPRRRASVVAAQVGPPTVRIGSGALALNRDQPDHHRAALRVTGVADDLRINTQAPSP